MVKKDKKVIGFTSVVGDLLHVGHIAMLNECKLHCDYLIVGLIADPKIDRPEKNEPVESLFERYYRLKNQLGVDEVIPMMGEDDLHLALTILNVNIRFVGEDYKGKWFTGKEVCATRGIEIFYNDRSHGLSSSNLRERVVNSK